MSPAERTRSNPRRWVAGLALAAALSAVAAPPCRAVESDTDPLAMADPDYAAGKRAIEERDWSAAIQYFSSAAQHTPASADIQNYLGYAHRNAGKLDAALQHYESALRLDPRHRGAHEYIGEAYLLVKNLAKAEEHLAALERICRLPCEEYADLKAKVAAYRKGAR